MEDYREELTMQTQDESDGDSPEPPEPRGEQTPEEEREPIEWDGSEAELVADDAAEYEDQQTGIKLSYILRREEIFECLKKSEFCKTTGTRAVAESVILGIMAIVFVVTYFLQQNMNSLFFAVISILLIGVIWIVPKQGMKHRAKELANGKEINMEVYPDNIVIGKAETGWEIPLDGTSECTRFRNLLVITTRENRMAILPLRCVEPAVLPEVQAMIIAGTQPKK